ncbi:MAG: DUF952 domain-containing protein [Anaerolineales bacterium]|nr:DUF952 domain-containing protein [Anaerolineales bacterium]
MIIHLTTKTAWQAAQHAGAYRADSLEKEGFIHCSTQEQILPVANFLYRGIPELVLLWLDPARVHAEIRWEPPVHPGASENSESAPAPAATNLFPHIYGPINLNAVFEVVDFLPDVDGIFRQVPGSAVT